MKVTLDRFEGDYAILLVRDDETVSIDFPACLLPKKCKEGDILDITIAKDVEETAEAKKRVSKLIDKLKKKNLE
jgi:hypothetical protein